MDMDEYGDNIEYYDEEEGDESDSGNAQQFYN